MPRKPAKQPKAVAPQFDDAPLDADDDEGACPIPDENGYVVLRRDKVPRRKRRGKGDEQPRKG